MCYYILYNSFKFLLQKLIRLIFLHSHHLRLWLNTTSNRAFSHFQNYHITINYVVDPKCILAMAPPNLKFVKASGPIDIVDKSNWFLFIFLLEPRLCLGCEFCNYFAMPFDLNKFYFCWFRRCTFQLRLNSFLLYPFVFEIWLSCFSEMHSLNWGWIFFWTPIWPWPFGFELLLLSFVRGTPSIELLFAMLLCWTFDFRHIWVAPLPLRMNSILQCLFFWLYFIFENCFLIFAIIFVIDLKFCELFNFFVM